MRLVRSALMAAAMTGLPVPLSSAALAQSSKSQVSASNGVAIDVYSDEFANRYEYSAPSVKVDDATILVATIKKAGVAPYPQLTGFVIYNGEWRRYSKAIFKGGDPAQFTLQGRNVGRCYSSRYSRPSCTLTESFIIELTPSDVAKHKEGDSISIQLRADDTSTVIMPIPISYIEAVVEVSKR